MNDNGILLMQPLVADAVDTLLPIGCNMSDDEYEDICDCIFTECLGIVCDGTDDIWEARETAPQLFLCRNQYRPPCPTCRRYAWPTD